jgi:hypothetical protein
MVSIVIDYQEAVVVAPLGAIAAIIRHEAALCKYRFFREKLEDTSKKKHIESDKGIAMSHQPRQ